MFALSTLKIELELWGMATSRISRPGHCESSQAIIYALRRTVLRNENMVDTRGLLSDPERGLTDTEEIVLILCSLQGRTTAKS